jgi:hypothetical protein
MPADSDEATGLSLIEAGMSPYYELKWTLNDK